MAASAKIKEKEKDEVTAASSRRRKAANISLKSNLMFGKPRIGKIKAGMKIGPGKNNKLKNPILPKEKERKEK